ncbi:MAG TPA: hypothetical protein VJU61_16485 [Polyangiaceae bacterium]|nr:hypothetical protein [Polyangiaceae bacterium]
MHTKQTEQPLSIRPAKLLGLVSALTGSTQGREDDEHPLPPGPWDPIIRVALEQVHFGRDPERVALNPQPLPPRFAFLRAVARGVLSRAELLQELADATQRSGEQQGIIIVGGYTSRFSDDWCGNGFKLRYPFPGPRPHWFASELDSTDLLVLAAQLQQSSTEAFSPALRRDLMDAGARFLEGALVKLR